jgi:hypothetical protein
MTVSVSSDAMSSAAHCCLALALLYKSNACAQ